MGSAKLAIALLSLTFTYVAFGQTGGTITGVISDPAGAVVPNAPLEAKNTATGVVLTAATSATGNYTLSNLPAGTYEIDVNVTGFKKYVQTGITVQQLQTTRVDVTLVIGSSTDSVTVSEAAPLLKTETGDVSHNVTTEQQNELPMGQIGTIRVSTQVILTIPGVNGGLTNMTHPGNLFVAEAFEQQECHFALRRRQNPALELRIDCDSETGDEVTGFTFPASGFKFAHLKLLGQSG